MTKPELVAFIMENTTDYKKTHLMDKRKDELEMIAAAFSLPVEATQNETYIIIPETQNNAVDMKGEAVQDVAEPKVPIVIPSEPEVPTGVVAIILETYEDNKKMVKGRRLDKDEFKETVLEKVIERATADNTTDTAAIKALTVSVMEQLLNDLVAFCPMNDIERKMLETIPLLPDYEDIGSQVNGKNFLQKVKELHNIGISTSRALMVSLKKKKYITIGGGKKTFIVLLERGIRHLRKTV